MSAGDGVRVVRALVLSLIVWISIGGEINQILVAQAAGSRGSPPETALAVSTATPDGPRITPYLRAQLDRAWRQDARRQARFDAVATEADLLALRDQIRQSMLDAIGGLPERGTPLNARTVGTERMDGYRIERVIFESLPGIHVTALVYVPDAPPASASSARRPAVLLACGHSPLGKAFVNYQRIAARLARLGFIVICWDPVGQGERSQFWDASRKSSRYDLVCGEHAILGNLATLAGANIARWMIWDGMRALDYLLARGDVDPARVAITGTSGGGFQSAWIGALDPRIAVIAPSAFISSLPMRMANRIFDDPASDPEQDPHGLVSAGIDHAGLLLAAYPRPVHVSAAVLDFFPIEGTRLTVRMVRTLDTRVGRGNRVALAEGYHKHAYSDENQLSAFAFIARAFDLPAPDLTTGDALPEVTVLPPERLQCTKSGQVREELPGRGLVDEIRAYYDARKSSRTLDLAALYRDAAKDEDGVNAAASSWDIVPDRGQPVGRAIAWTLTGSSTTDDVVIDRYRLRHHGRQTVPLLHIRRAVPTPTSASTPTARRTVIHVDLRGKVTAASWHRVRALLDAGMDVVSVDLPATGELRMRFRVETEPYLKSLSDLDLSDHPVASVLANHAYNGLLTGRPYLIDALQTIEIADRFARAQLRASDVAISGAGQAATLASAASTVWPSLALLSAPDADPFDWQTAVQRGTELWPIHYLLPGGAYARLRPAAAPPVRSQASPSQSVPSPSIAISAPVLFDTPEADAILERLQVFPSDNPWNQDISKLPVHNNSAAIIASIGVDKPLDFNLDMNFIIVPPDQRRVDVELVQYPNESDPGPFPIPDNAPIENWPLARNEATGALPKPGQTLDSFQREGTGDRHLLVVDPVNGKLHELYRAYRTDKGWRADNSATFDLRTGALRPERWTSADAAGLPIFPAVVRYDEVAAGLVRHAMRVTVRRTRRGYVLPATHWASRSTDPSLPRMGERLRLKAGFDTSGFPPHARAVLEGLKRYGMFVADNGRDWLMSIAPDRRFEGLETLTRVKGSDFEVVETGARSVEDR